MSPDRIMTLMGKELREFRAAPGALAPIGIPILLSLAFPLIGLVAVPRITGQPVSADEDLRELVVEMFEYYPALAALSIEAATEAFLFQHFMFLFLIGPVVGACSLAAYSVVGEKQGRTLEPLLTTPLTTAEIVVAKAVASFLPALVVEILSFGLFVGTIAVFGSPGVAGALITLRTAVLLGLVGPLASLTALQMAIAVSSRANDPRSAQQIAVLVVLPIIGLLIGQLTGVFVLGMELLLLAAAALAMLWVLVAMFSVALFERETILTRWK